MGKQKTYGRFLGMIFWEEGQPGHPPQGKAVTAAKTPKNRKTTKKSLFFLGQNRQESANKTEKFRRRRERGQPALTLGGSDGVNAKLQALLVMSSVVGRSCCSAGCAAAQPYHIFPEVERLRCPGLLSAEIFGSHRRSPFREKCDKFSAFEPRLLRPNFAL